MGAMHSHHPLRRRIGRLQMDAVCAVPNGSHVCVSITLTLTQITGAGGGGAAGGSTFNPLYGTVAWTGVCFFTIDMAPIGDRVIHRYGSLGDRIIHTYILITDTAPIGDRVIYPYMLITHTAPIGDHPMDRQFVIRSLMGTASVVSYTKAIDATVPNGSRCCSEQNIPVHPWSQWEPFFWCNNIYGDIKNGYTRHWSPMGAIKLLTTDVAPVGDRGVYRSLFTAHMARIAYSCREITPGGPQWEPHLWCMGASMSSPQMRLPLGTAHHGSISSPQIRLPLGTVGHGSHWGPGDLHTPPDHTSRVHRGLPTTLSMNPFTTDMAPIGDRSICRLFFTTDAAPTGDRVIWKHLLTTDATPIGDRRSNRNWYMITTRLPWGTVTSASVSSSLT
ncbi:hypothetical protein BD769DRAFT_1392284 [Suillus cothurnatus]|nr:hypothetical protein BD769DRAFT_1392284 [Suillus cothurnatus]